MAKRSEKIGRTVGVLAAAAGVVAVGTIVAGGTAAGILVESFKSASSAVKETMAGYKKEDQDSNPETEEAIEQEFGEE